MIEYDPTKVDTEQLESDIDLVDAQIKNQEIEAKLKQQREEEAQRAAQEEQDRPKGVIQEASSAVVGGLVDTVNDVTSIPQRAVDLASGEMQRQGADYKPTWLQLDEDPFETTTWWGGLLRGAVNFGSLFFTGGLAAKGIGMGLKGAGVALSAPRVAPILSGAAKGAAADAVALSSLEDNMSSIVIKHIPEMEAVLGPLATKETDHPMMKTFKNMVEGLGLGMLVDLAILRRGAFKVPELEAAPPVSEANLELLALPPAREMSVDSKGRYVVSQGSPSELQRLLLNKRKLEQRLAKSENKKRNNNLLERIKDIEEDIQRVSSEIPDVQVDQRNRSIENQTVERGREELGSGEFGPYKNKGIANRDQGNALSQSSPMKVRKQLDQIDNDPTAARGSTDNMVTSMQAKRASETGGTEKLVKDTIRELVSEAEYQKMMKTAKAKNIPFSRMHETAVLRYKSVVEGRETTDMSVDEFLEPLTRNMANTGGDLPLPYIPYDELLSVDLLLGSLTRQIRDLSMVGRDVVDVVDTKAAGSTLEVLKERAIATLKLSRRTRYLWGLGGAQMKGISDFNPLTVAEGLKKQEELAEQSINTIMKIIREDPSDEALKAFYEMMSSGELRTLEDLDAAMRRRILGGEKEGTGALLKEMQAVAVNSLLSGPKTPVRTAMGNTIFTSLRYTSQALGGMMRGDAATAISSRASIAAAVGSIPEAWTLFTKNLQAYMKNDVATIKTRFSNYTVADQEWEAMGHWVESRGSFGEKAAYRMMSIARNLNNNSLLTYGSRIMAATDDAFKYIMARARSREQSIRKVLETGADVGDKDLVRKIEDDFYGKMLDEDGDLYIQKDPFLNAAYKEVTLQTELTGFMKSFETLFNKSPYTKPFFLFARTGINGLSMTAKHMPVIGGMMKESRAVLSATADNLDSVRMYGINSAAELDNAKALIKGRQTIGAAVIMGTVGMYMGGNLTGNGPADRTKRQSWIDAGWKPRSIKVGDAWVSYDAFEPFNTVLAAVADVGDHQQLMGDEWVEEGLMQAAFLVGSAAVNKTMLAGLNQLVELTNGGYSAERIMANLINNQIPLSSARNELGKLINPGMKELNGGFWESINNRNLFLDPTDMPEKYDLLTGKPIRDWHFMERMFNAISPVHFSFDDNPGRELLIRSGYDTRMSVYSIPSNFGGGNLNEHPRARSEVQRAIGEQNLERQLAQLAKDPKVKASMEKMQRDLNAGVRDLDPMSYYHNQRIDAIFKAAQSKAWAIVSSKPSVLAAIKAQRDINIRNAENDRYTDNLEPILTIPK